MPTWKLRYQFYAIRCDTKEEAIAKAVKMIKADVEAFVLDAEPPAPMGLGGLAKMVLTGK